MFGPEYREHGTFFGENRPSVTGQGREFFWVYPGFPTLFWGLSVLFVGDLMGKALWKLVENEVDPILWTGIGHS